MSSSRQPAKRSGRDSGRGRASGVAADAGRVYAGEPLHERRRDQRRRLLVAARSVFAENGYARASIDEIVAAARVSRTSFYRFFASKEECLVAVFEETMELIQGAFTQAASADDPEERIRRGVRQIVGGFAADPEGARVVLIEVVGATPAIEQARIEARSRFATLLEAEMRRYPGWRSRPDEEIRLVAVATMAAIVESVSELVVSGRADEWEATIEPLTGYALRALTPG